MDFRPKSTIVLGNDHELKAIKVGNINPALSIPNLSFWTQSESIILQSTKQAAQLLDRAA